MSGHDLALRFFQRLIQTPSMPGEKGAIAEMVRAEMQRLGYDETWVDEAGGVSHHFGHIHISRIAYCGVRSAK